MLLWFKQLDGILRGDATRLPALQEGKISFPIGGLTIVTILLGVIYGLCMGSFAMIRTSGQAYMQLIASAIKLPMLFFLTLAVTFPSLYVFNALIGSRLSMASVFRLLIASLGVMLAVLASLGPIVVFFAVSTNAYPFMVVLNVAASTVAGILGLAFLLRTLHRLVLVQEQQEYQRWRLSRPQPTTIKDNQNVNSGSVPPNQSNPSSDHGGDSFPNPPNDLKSSEKPTAAIDLIGESIHHKAKSVFQIWTIVFALVGAQMSWVLRPFIGDPDLEFAWFRERESNFFIAVLEAIGNLFGL